MSSDAACRNLGGLAARVNALHQDPDRRSCPNPHLAVLSCSAKHFGGEYISCGQHDGMCCKGYQKGLSPLLRLALNASTTSDESRHRSRAYLRRNRHVLTFHIPLRGFIYSNIQDASSNLPLRLHQIHLLPPPPHLHSQLGIRRADRLKLQILNFLLSGHETKVIPQQQEAERDLDLVRREEAACNRRSAQTVSPLEGAIECVPGQACCPCPNPMCSAVVMTNWCLFSLPGC